MTDLISSPRPAWTSSPRFLWSAVGVLGVAAVAMGVALVQVTNPTPQAAAPVPLVAASPAPAVPASSPGAVAVPPVVAAVEASKVPATPEKRAQAAPKTVAKVPAVKPATRSANTDMEVFEPATPATRNPAPAKVVCLRCGTVEAVTAVQREAKPSGAGAVAGAVLGGLLGNQVGGGDGKTVATVLGAVGGGIAGNTVEKRMKKELVYQVDVRMEDGSVRTLEQTTPLAVGTKVTVDGNVISPRGALQD